MAILFPRSKNLEKSWPFVPEALLKQLNDIDEVQVVNVERDQPIGEVYWFKVNENFRRLN